MSARRIPNFLALEWHAASGPFFDELLATGGPVIVDGHISLPEGPGIGADLDLDVARRYARPGEPFFGELLGLTANPGVPLSLDRYACR